VVVAEKAGTFEVVAAEAPAAGGLLLLLLQLQFGQKALSIISTFSSAFVSNVYMYMYRERAGDEFASERIN